MHRFKNRQEAGRLLADRLSAWRDVPDILVLGLARGGMPVAFEIAKALHQPLDVMIVRKLGAPGQEELAIGALSSAGVVWNDELVRMLGVTPDARDAVLQKERHELHRRETAYRGNRTPLDVAGKTVILVDDGIATGASMRAAIVSVQAASPAAIILAVPVAPGDTCESLAPTVKEVVCLMQPEHFGAVGQWYVDFSQTADEEVTCLMNIDRP